MISVVFYDAASRALQECCTGNEQHLKATGRPFVEVDEHRHDWRVTHVLSPDRRSLVARDPAQVAAETRSVALRLLRAQRDMLLRRNVDAVGPLRFAGLTAEKQAALASYRQALLDLPSTVEDPSNPVWPTYPL